MEARPSTSRKITTLLIFGLVIYFILFFLLHQAVRGILVPCPRIKIVFHVVEAQSLNEWTTRVHLHLLESAGDGQHF